MDGKITTFYISSCHLGHTLVGNRWPDIVCVRLQQDHKIAGKIIYICKGSPKIAVQADFHTLVHGIDTLSELCFKNLLKVLISATRIVKSCYIPIIKDLVLVALFIKISVSVYCLVSEIRFRNGFVFICLLRHRPKRKIFCLKQNLELQIHQKKVINTLTILIHIFSKNSQRL